MRISKTVWVGTGIAMLVGLVLAAFVTSPSPIDQLVFTVVVGVASFAALLIVFSMKKVKASDKPLQRLILTLTLFGTISFISAVQLFYLVILLAQRSAS